MTRVTLLALTAVAASLLPGCAGNGTQIMDGQRCETWLHGNGRDRYLAAHGMAEYDAGNTRRRAPRAIEVGALMDRYCKDSPSLLIDEALRLAGSSGGAPAEPTAGRAPSTTGTQRTKRTKRP